MNILYISISFPKENEGNNLYTDLAEEISKKHKITVVATEEKKNSLETRLQEERGMEVLRVKVGNMFNVSLKEKAISYITLPIIVNKAIKKYLKESKYDMVLYTAPPVTIEKIIKYAKHRFKCISYLMQKDIFPQNAVDIGIMKKNSIVYCYFKTKEKKLYKISDRIGCMSEKNMQYIIENNKGIKNLKNKVEIFPNTIMLRKQEKNMEIDEIKDKYNIPKDKMIALYGGNFGKPQGIDFIIELLEFYKDNDRIFWLFVGRGTEKKKIQEAIKEKNIQNALLLDYIPKEEYNKLLLIADIGLIFLDNRFTIPNIPSRLLSYLEYNIPILAATDKNTDLSNILQENNIGLWCESGDIKEFNKNMNYYMENQDKRIEIGMNGRKYLERYLTTERSVEILENAYKRVKIEY